MHDAGAGRANRSQAAELRPIGPELDLVESRSPGLFAAEAIQPAGSARAFPADAAAIEEVDQVHAADDRRVAIPDRLKPDRQPVTDSARGRARGLGGFPDVVRAQPLDATGRVSPVCQGT